MLTLVHTLRTLANSNILWWIADNQYIYVAPEYDSGTELEVEYYQEVPYLGATLNRVNDEYQPINSAGQTVTQWIAASNSNTQATLFKLQ